MIKTIKLSELDKGTKVIDENYNVYTVEDVLTDLKYFKDKEKSIYTTTEYRLKIDAMAVLENTFTDEYEKGDMYEGWLDYICNDITGEDVQEVQSVIDSILSRSPDTNVAYYRGTRVRIDV